MMHEAIPKICDVRVEKRKGEENTNEVIKRMFDGCKVALKQEVIDRINTGKTHGEPLDDSKLDELT
jgi:hypothetical protein